MVIVHLSNIYFTWLSLEKKYNRKKRRRYNCIMQPKYEKLTTIRCSDMFAFISRELLCHTFFHFFPPWVTKHILMIHVLQSRFNLTEQVDYHVNSELSGSRLLHPNRVFTIWIHQYSCTDSNVHCKINVPVKLVIHWRLYETAFNSLHLTGFDSAVSCHSSSVKNLLSKLNSY